MRNLILFMMISLDGYFEGPNHDISWHTVDAEFNEFAAEQLDSVDVLLFGRVTYELMASFWPTSFALETDPVIAYKMNAKTKLVCSTSLPAAGWANTQIIKDDVAAEIKRLKQQPGQDLIIFGSSTLAVTLAKQGLIDEYRIMVAPLFLGQGRSLLDGLGGLLTLRLRKSRSFGNGNVLLTYLPETNRL